MRLSVQWGSKRAARPLLSSKANGLPSKSYSQEAGLWHASAKLKILVRNSRVISSAVNALCDELRHVPLVAGSGNSY